MKLAHKKGLLSFGAILGGVRETSGIVNQRETQRPGHLK